MMATVLAQMWGDGDHMDGGWWWVMGIGWLVFLAAVVVIIAVLLVRRSDRRGGGGTRNRPEDVLAERLARGEIDEDEYRRRRDALRA